MRELARTFLALPVTGRMAVDIGLRLNRACRAIISASEGEAAAAAPNAAGVIRLGARAGPRLAARGETYWGEAPH